MSKSTHIALYGNTKIQRGYCSACDSWALILGGRLQCCDAVFAETPRIAKRIVEPDMARRYLSEAQKREIIAEQDGRCLYCERQLSGFVWDESRGATRRLRTHWDHMVPLSYGGGNAQRNFAASCHICNGIKGDRVFRDLDEARLYINNVRNEKGIH